MEITLKLVAVLDGEYLPGADLITVDQITEHGIPIDILKPVLVAGHGSLRSTSRHGIAQHIKIWKI